ncbi:sigma-70 family RNA polymerase sigma factor [Acuticoccus kandeliae]|uniref:sigma-70 family RNA polymerase sigma factor n=1 Tax=Acuticoccus kandeliae TaxID=2073160 RepID=UPI000D3E4AAC|nr:sigma-70 family RNA polymerase sigma factor [Acuticoccus kandeliae]
MARKGFDIVAEIEPLRRYARILTRDEEAADDLVQATFVRAFERRSSFRDGSNVRVWLMSVMHNLFIDRTRSARAAQAREKAWAELKPVFANPEGEAAARLMQLRAAFLSLPRDQREALHLVSVEGLSVAEAGAILAIPVGTVMSRVGRARAALRNFEDRNAELSRPRNLRLVRGGHDTER